MTITDTTPVGDSTEDEASESQTDESTEAVAEAPVVRQAPYSALGVDVTGKTLDEALEAVGADFNVVLAPVQAYDSNGVTDMSDYRAVLREDTREGLSIQGVGYTPIQYRQVAELAEAAVDLRPNDLVLERMGTWANGRRFYATVNLGSLFLDPAGVNDEIVSLLHVFSSHDGSLAVTIAEDNLRLICFNQAPILREKGKRQQGGLYAKHTKGMFDKLAVARKAIGVADKAREAFVKQAEALLAAPASEQTVRSTIRKVWGEPGDSDRAKTVAATREATILGIYNGDRCVKAVGHNKWAVFNAFTEYLDHGRGTSTDKRAVASMEPGGWVTKRKTEVGALLLAG